MPSLLSALQGYSDRLLGQNRLGLKAVKVFQDDVAPVFSIEWVDEASHQASMDILFSKSERHLSFVDCASFNAMGRLGITTAFAFDQHFAAQGFAHIP